MHIFLLTLKYFVSLLVTSGNEIGRKKKENNITHTQSNTRIYVENSNREKPRSRKQIHYSFDKITQERTPHSHSMFSLFLPHRSTSHTLTQRGALLHTTHNKAP